MNEGVGIWGRRKKQCRWEGNERKKKVEWVAKEQLGEL